MADDRKELVAAQRIQRSSLRLAVFIEDVGPGILVTRERRILEKAIKNWHWVLAESKEKP